MKTIRKVFGILAMALTASAVQADVVTNAMDTASWGYKIIGLGAEGHETAYVFTNTTAAMSWTAPEGVTSAQLLVVGGGGAGGNNDGTLAIGGGGGGAGGYLYESQYAVVANQAYSIVVGAGAVKSDDVSGADSTFGNLVAKGGGCGGTQNVGQTGGSGGGGAGKKDSSTTFSGGDGTQGQGFAGGKGDGYWKVNHLDAGTGGGGGGAAGAGGDAPSDEQGGVGGAGKTCAITGVEVVYCSGGGGGTDSGVRTFNEAIGTYNGVGGIGAGDGGDKNHEAGGDAVGYGCGGGGAAGSRNASISGGKGFQGVVVVRVNAHDEPLAYTRLWDYLRGDGVGCLKTDYVPDMRKTRIEMTYEHTGTDGFCLFQANKSSATDEPSDDDGMMICYYAPKQMSFYNFDGEAKEENYNPDFGKRHTISVGNKTMTIDGGRYAVSIENDAYAVVQGPLVFFRRNVFWGGKKTYHYLNRIYSVKIYETENEVEKLVHDYVPATKEGQNAGFWDRVENKYIPATSAGFLASDLKGIAVTVE